MPWAPAPPAPLLTQTLPVPVVLHAQGDAIQPQAWTSKLQALAKRGRSPDAVVTCYYSTRVERVWFVVNIVRPCLARRRIMDFPLDLSSRIEHRIDHELFYDDSDQLSLPGMSPHASMTQSISETTGLPSPSDATERTTRPAPPAAPRPPEMSEALNAQLLDTSASMSLPLPAANTSDLASSVSGTPELSTDKSEDGQFLTQGASDAGAFVSRASLDTVCICSLTSGTGSFVGIDHRVPIDFACAELVARRDTFKKPTPT